eukprot:TRINITY_DN3054_c0_g5_i2.p1 TRINITY_DN3054_c0_g5~~TRINITY_DN3054_c0_g5_i2.p1  ORF type:complete len:399 (+),score=116.45 TRINITY_DN3054_c0_g5_i2:33-1229(+)
MSSCVLRRSEEFITFKSQVPLQKLGLVEKYGTEVVESLWQYYEHGDRGAECGVPLVVLPSLAGTTQSFFRLINRLYPVGVRVISVEPPPYYSVNHFSVGFEAFLKKLKIPKAHILGCGFGGFLAQVFAKMKPHKVQSLILCNTFCDNEHFHNSILISDLFMWMPEFILRRTVLSLLPQDSLAPETADAIDFIVEMFENVDADSLTSRLVLLTKRYHIQPHECFDNEKVTIINSLDDTSVPEGLKSEVFKLYPNSKLAEVRSGGEFPYLSQPDEFALHLKVHIRRHAITMAAAQQEEDARLAQIAAATKQTSEKEKKTKTESSSSAAAASSDDRERAPFAPKSSNPLFFASNPSTSITTAASTSTSTTSVIAERWQQGPEETSVRPDQGPLIPSLPHGV